MNLTNEAGTDFRDVKLGDILVTMGIIKPEQLQEALKQCQPDQKDLGQVLVGMGYTTEEKIIKAVSIRLGVKYLNSFEGMIEPQAVKTVPESMARKHLIVPIFRTEDSLTIGMVNPLDLQAVDEVVRHTGLRVHSVMTTLANLFHCVQTAYGRSNGSGAGSAAAEKTVVMTAPVLSVERSDKPAPAIGQIIEQPRMERPIVEHFPSPQVAPRQIAGDDDQSAVDLANQLLQEGMTCKASDIHIESAEKLVRVRYRVDGILKDGRTFEKEIAPSFIARIKILAKLDITETRLPQDGHLRFDYAGRGVDIRVSILPTIHGEKIVMRILDSSKGIKKLTEIGLSAPNLKNFSAAIQRPNGVVLVTGPTGSGKTTTLYAAVAHLNDATRNIVTLEDPVEYRIDRVNQLETHTKIGLTFAAGLRSILRQDPNVILVGEIRDLEMAEIAIQAAVTGHLVFSTLHTNNAVATIHRLLNMRVEPFLISAALAGVMAQRLVRQLCPRCKRQHKLTAGEVEALGASLKVGMMFYEPVGCDDCLKTGYSGRIAIHEWLTMTRTIREAILQRVSIDELTSAAKAEGMISLQDDALEKASRGLTSLAEVVRVTREDKEG
jgi:type IV pilus assembly protein PilB